MGLWVQVEVYLPFVITKEERNEEELGQVMKIDEERRNLMCSLYWDLSHVCISKVLNRLSGRSSNPTQHRKDWYETQMCYHLKIYISICIAIGLDAGIVR